MEDSKYTIQYLTKILHHIAGSDKELDNLFIIAATQELQGK